MHAGQSTDAENAKGPLSGKRRDDDCKQISSRGLQETAKDLSHNSKRKAGDGNHAEANVQAGK